MQIINLTPHSISVADADGNLIATFEPAGSLARVKTTKVELTNVLGIPVSKTEFGDVENIPAPQEGMVYLVSTLVAQAAKRVDVVSPDTGPTAIRKEGQVIAVRAFQAF